MKLHNTLTIMLSLLITNNVYALDANATKCNDAINQAAFSTALDLANQSLKLKGDDKEALICKGRAQSGLGESAAALATLSQAKKAAKEPFDQLIVEILIGNAHRAANQTEAALNAYLQAANLAKAQNNPNYERISFNQIGDTHYAKQQYAQALTAYEQAYKLTANDNERGESYENIALTYHQLNDANNALAYQIKAYVTHEKVGSLDQYAHSSIELGRYYAIVKNYVAAENVLKKIIKFSKEQGGAYFEAKGSSVLAKVKLAQGNQAEADKLTAYAKKIATDTQDAALTQEIDQEANI